MGKEARTGMDSRVVGPKIRKHPSDPPKKGMRELLHKLQVKKPPQGKKVRFFRAREGARLLKVVLYKTNHEVFTAFLSKTLRIWGLAIREKGHHNYSGNRTYNLEVVKKLGIVGKQKKVWGEACVESGILNPSKPPVKKGVTHPFPEVKNKNNMGRNKYSRKTAWVRKKKARVDGGPPTKGCQTWKAKRTGLI